MARCYDHLLCPGPNLKHRWMRLDQNTLDHLKGIVWPARLVKRYAPHCFIVCGKELLCATTSIIAHLTPLHEGLIRGSQRLIMNKLTVKDK